MPTYVVYKYHRVLYYIFVILHYIITPSRSQRSANGIWPAHSKAVCGPVDDLTLIKRGWAKPCPSNMEKIVRCWISPLKPTINHRCGSVAVVFYAYIWVYHIKYGYLSVGDIISIPHSLYSIPVIHAFTITINDYKCLTPF